MMQSIKSKQESLIEEFKEIDDWKERYRAIIEFGAELKPLPEQFRDERYLIKECQNRIWLAGVSTQKDNQNVIDFYADGESQIVKGLAAILIHLYSGHQPSEILNTPAEFIPSLGLGDNLTRNRFTGLNALVTRIKQIALSMELKT